MLVRRAEAQVIERLLGASWEGFAMEQVVARLGVEPEHCFFWATHAGAELDLLVVRGGRKVGFEFKRSSAPKLTRSMRSARETLGLDELIVVFPGERGYPLGEGVRRSRSRSSTSWGDLDTTSASWMLDAAVHAGLRVGGER